MMRFAAPLETFLPEGITLCRLKYTQRSQPPLHPLPYPPIQYTSPPPHSLQLPTTIIRSSSQQARSIFEHIGKSWRNSFPDVLVAHSALLFRHQPTNRPHCQHLIFFFLSPIHHPCCCHCTTYRSRQVFSSLSHLYLLLATYTNWLSIELGIPQVVVVAACTSRPTPMPSLH